MNISDIMNKAKNQLKEITIIYNGVEKDLEISPMRTVKYLKEEIERLFNLEPGSLKLSKLRMAFRGLRTGIILDNENKILFDYRIKHGCRITFSLLQNTGGGGPITFTSFKEKEFRKFGPAPDWRTVRNGLNFYGICSCKLCPAGKDNKEVICPMDLRVNEEFNLINDKNKIRCPMCSSFLDLKTIGIHKCKITVRGKFINGKSVEDFDQTFRAEEEDGLEKFNYGEDNEFTWTELIFKIDEYY